MTSLTKFGTAQARLLCLLDDATQRICAESSVGVVLSGTAQDAAVLGFASLYKSDPVRSYAIAGDTIAHAAAFRFGALHQTCRLHGTDPVAELSALVAKDGLEPLSGATTGTGPFADPAVVAFFAQLPDDVNPAQLLANALEPLLGQALSRLVEGCCTVR